MIITPINPKAAGSFRDRKEGLTLIRTAQSLVKSNDVNAIADVYDKMEEIVRRHVLPDEGKTLDDEIALLSEEGMMGVLNQILGGSNDTIPPSSTSS